MKRSAPDGLEEAIRVATVGVGFGVGVTVGTRVFVAVGTSVWVLVGVTVMVCVGVGVTAEEPIVVFFSYEAMTMSPLVLFSARSRLSSFPIVYAGTGPVGLMVMRISWESDRKNPFMV